MSNWRARSGSNAASRVGCIRDAALLRNQDYTQSVLTPKHDDDFRRLRCVGRQTGQLRIVPVGEVYDGPRRRACVCTLVWLYDIHSVAVEEERVVPEQFAQLLHQRMVIGEHPGFQLGQSLFNLRGIELRSALHSLGS